MKNKRNTRSVFEVRQLDIFVKSPAIKKICKYNSLSRDNHRIYLKFIGISFCFYSYVSGF